MKKKNIKLTKEQQAILLAKFNKAITSKIEVEINPIELTQHFTFRAII